MILYFKHIIHIDDFPLNGHPPSYLYNSVATCRHITISTSASEPRNAKKSSVKIDVSMFGPEL